jgi:diguanylate cyclase (GGDEF)-like protein
VSFRWSDGARVGGGDPAPLRAQPQAALPPKSAFGGRQSDDHVPVPAYYFWADDADGRWRGLIGPAQWFARVVPSGGGPLRSVRVDRPSGPREWSRHAMTMREDLPTTGRSQVARVGEFGPAHWLAFASFEALARRSRDDAIAEIRANEALARGLGDDTTGWRCRDILVAALSSGGLIDESVTVAEDLMSHYRSDGDELARLQILGQVITTRFARNEFERALDELTEALVGLSHVHEASRAGAAAFLTIANAASSAEMFELASAQLRRGYKLVEAVGDEFLIRMADGTVAQNETRWAARLEMIGRPEEAAARYREALRAAIRAQRGDPLGYWWRIGRLYEGFAWTCLHEPELGRATMLDALGMDAAPLGVEDSLVLRFGLARACTALGLTPEARYHLEQTFGVRDTTFSDQWQVGIVLQAAQVEQAESGEHPGVALARHAAVLLANSLWEERERRLESVMVRMQMLDLAEENERVGQAATQDPLTGLGNRRRLDAALHELTTAPTAPTCLLFIDLDRFKWVNDTFSHAIGDDVLKVIAEILERESRERDVVTRYGGDEFVVMLRGAALRTGMRVGERIRRAVAAHPWSRTAPGLDVRVSVGVAEHLPGMTYNQLMAAADSAVYEAKEMGRDRVAVA